MRIDQNGHLLYQDTKLNLQGYFTTIIIIIIIIIIICHITYAHTEQIINSTKEEREAAPIGRSFPHSKLKIWYSFQHKNIYRHMWQEIINHTFSGTVIASAKYCGS
jgi:hypothetical protein